MDTETLRIVTVEQCTKGQILYNLATVISTAIVNKIFRKFNTYLGSAVLS